MIYFAWISREESFDPDKHRRYDLPIVTLTLEEKEGAPAHMTIVTRNFLSHPPHPNWKKNYAMISYQDKSGALTPLIKAKVSRMEHDKDNLLTLSLELMDRDESQKKMFDFLNACFVRENPFWDSLVDSDEDLCQTYFSNHSQCGYWNRISHDISLVDWEKPAKNLFDLSNKYDQNSLETWIDPPVTQISVQACAQWVQQVQGFLNLGPIVRGLFPHRYVHTYTGDDFQKNWPKTGMALGRSGYRIVQSNLEVVPPPFATPAQCKGHSALRIETSIQEGKSPQTFYVAKTWFRAHLLLSFGLRQKRQETLGFCLKTHLQVPSVRQENWRIRLGCLTCKDPPPLWNPYFPYQALDMIQHEENVYECIRDHLSTSSFDETFWRRCPESTKNLSITRQSHFFQSKRGQMITRRLLIQARNFLAKQARCHYTKITGMLLDLGSLSTADWVFFRDTRLSGGYLRGKIIQFQIKAEYPDARVNLTIASFLGDDRVDFFPPPDRDPYTDKDYVLEDYVRIDAICPHSVKDIFYYPLADCVPKDFYADPSNLHQKNLIKRIFLRNGPNEQEQKIKNASEKNQLNPETLKSLGTHLHIEMNPLKGYAPMEQINNLKIAQTWKAPKDIFLKG